LPVDLRIAAMQTLVGAFVDGVGCRIVGMALAEGDHVPRQPTSLILGQSKDKPVRSGAGALLPEGDVELATTWKARPVGALRLAPPPAKRGPASFNFLAGAFGLEAGRRSLV